MRRGRRVAGLTRGRAVSGRDAAPGLKPRRCSFAGRSGRAGAGAGPGAHTQAPAGLLPPPARQGLKRLVGRCKGYLFINNLLRCLQNSRQCLAAAGSTATFPSGTAAGAALPGGSPWPRAMVAPGACSLSTAARCRARSGRGVTAPPVLPERRRCPRRLRSAAAGPRWRRRLPRGSGATSRRRQRQPGGNGRGHPAGSGRERRGRVAAAGGQTQPGLGDRAVLLGAKGPGGA